jgi:DNA/RNA endonuclease YhcR with UshA esterase domain
MRLTTVVCLVTFALVSRADDRLMVISPQQAAGFVNKRCIMEMPVKSTGKSNDGKLIFLNSEPSFKDKGNFGIVIDLSALEKLKKAKIDDPAAYFLNKRVRVTGTVSLYKDNPQMRLVESEDITVVPK